MDERTHPRTGQVFPSPVPPGSGWPGDRATESTPVAHSASEVEGLAARAETLPDVEAATSVCRACPRLVEWREDVAQSRKRSFSDQPYWGRPVPSFGAEHPSIAIIGLAPSAHGGNRTGRQFTGDPSGDWLFAALHRVGLANQGTSVDAADGLELDGVRLIPAVHCAPPQNKPSVSERDACAPWMRRELELITGDVDVLFTLGSFAWSAALRSIRALGWRVPKPQPKFGHGVLAQLHTPQGRAVTLLGSYHVSQRNTQTGSLTTKMLDDVLNKAKLIADRGDGLPH